MKNSSEALHVVHSCTSKSFSGLEAYVLDLVTWQYKHGYSVELFCRSDSELYDRAVKAGVPVWSIAYDATKGPRLWTRLRSEWKHRIAKDRKLVLHMHAGGEPWIHIPVLPRSVRRILHYHIWINHKKRDPMHALLFSQIDEVWTSSESSRAHLASLLPIHREKIFVVPYGRDLEALDASGESRESARAKFKIPHDAVLALAISRIEKIKGVGELFDAFAEIAPKNEKAWLLLVGDVSPDNAEAENFARELKRKYSELPGSIRQRFLMPGFLSPVAPLMRAADFYVLPSYEECMSLAMLDAAALGLPILGTNAGGTPSVARPDESGDLVPPRNAKALAKAMDLMFSNASARKKLSMGAREIGRKFDREKIFESIWSQYQR